MSRLSAWCRAHPLTSLLLGVIVLAVSVHLFANWRAEVRWQRYAAEARARGVKLKLTDFAKPKIPDAENFAALPMFRAIFAGGVQQPMKIPWGQGPRPDFGNAVKGERIDWKAWQTFCKDAGWITETTDSPPRDVLRGLEHYAPQFAQWREWPQRPRSRFPLELEKGFAMSSPHIGTFNDAAKIFALQTRAHLALGDSSAAYGALQDLLQGRRALLEEPTLLSGLIRMSVTAHAVNVIGEGLREVQWADEELGRLAMDLAAISVWSDFRLAFESEHAGMNSIYEMMASASPWKRAGHWTGLGLGAGPASGGALMALIPKRVYRDNQLQGNRYFDELLTRVNAEATSYDPDLPIPSDPENLTGWLDRYYFFLNRMSLPVFHSVIERYVSLQTQLDEARVAIALERHRLARGGFPETLAELVPEFLPAVPVDTYSKQPLVYRRQEGGTFLLYGVGKNRRDDGGTIDPKLGERKQLDDVWLHAPPVK